MFVVAARWEPPSLLESRGLYWCTFELGVQKVPQGPLFNQVSLCRPCLHTAATAFLECGLIVQLEGNVCHAELVTLGVMSLSVLMESATWQVSGALQVMRDFTCCLWAGTLLLPVFSNCFSTHGPMEDIHTNSWLLSYRTVALTWKVRSWASLQSSL